MMEIIWFYLLSWAEKKAPDGSEAEPVCATNSSRVAFREENKWPAAGNQTAGKEGAEADCNVHKINWSCLYLNMRPPDIGK